MPRSTPADVGFVTQVLFGITLAFKDVLTGSLDFFTHAREVISVIG
jgi:hypothetical protein